MKPSDQLHSEIDDQPSDFKLSFSSNDDKFLSLSLSSSWYQDGIVIKRTFDISGTYIISLRKYKFTVRVFILMLV